MIYNGGGTMSKDKTFIVRIDEADLNEFNKILKRKSINRSELMRKWIQDYIKKDGDMNDKG